jgi:ElaB/YqjD/DUF883 family membrane-anchored ribosome-binding protein
METTSEEGTRVYDREEEYLAAQRAAVESLQIGRDTLEQSQVQGEQLSRSEALADETQYKLDKAGRILRGMTWSGWMANAFTRGTGPPPSDTLTKAQRISRLPPAVYVNVPAPCRDAAQTVQNYHANVKVLEECETYEQKNTCQQICDNMYQAAQAEMAKLKSHPQVEAYRLQFESDLELLQERQGKQLRSPMRSATENSGNHKEELLSNHKTTVMNLTASRPQPSPCDIVRQRQDQHLDTISQSLGELGSIAQNLKQSFQQQNETIDKLDTKSDNILEKSKMVTRRADRIIQKKSWTPVKPTFACMVTIRHVSSGKYLAVADTDLNLVPKQHPETCVFALWKRQGEIFGLKNKFNNKWVGQNLFGSLACSASSFGRREEWEAEEDWTNSRILCASAGWGAGGYLNVRPTDHGIVIGGYGFEERKKADAWSIVDLTAI